MKKSIKIITIVLACLVVLVGIGAVLYAKTGVLNFLKSPNQLFFKYISKNIEGEKIDYEEVLEKAYKKSYEAKGKISIELEADEDLIDEELVDLLNDSEIIYLEKSNPKEEKAYGKITYVNDGDNIIDLEILKEKDTYAIKSDKIYDKYIAVENENLKDLVEKFGIDSTDVPDKLELTDPYELMFISNKDLKKIKNTYKDAINDLFDKENFEKSKEEIEVFDDEVKANAYTLTIDDKDACEAITSILKTIKSDDLLLGLVVEKYNMVYETTEGIDSYYDEDGKIKKSDLEDGLKSLIDDLEKTENFSDDEIKIIVYENKGETVRTEIVIEDEILRLDRKVENDKTTMKLQFVEDNEVTMEFCTIEIEEDKDTTTVKLLSEIEEVKLEVVITEIKDEEVTMKLSIDTEELKATVNFENKIEYKKVDIDSITDKNSVILNNATEDELEKIKEDVMTNAEDFYNDNKDLFEVLENLANNNNTYSNYDFDDDYSIDEEKAKIHNAKIEKYIGTKTGKEVKELIQVVIDNNEEYWDFESEDVYLININFSSLKEDLEELMNDYDDNATYEVTMEYGYSYDNVYQYVTIK